MATKSKATTAIAAGVLSAALLLGGTFAWTSLGQRVKNETIVDVNPGGRLHDDFNGITGDKNVYVENFSEDPDGVPIYARIRLDEYMESGPDAGINRFPAEGETRNVDVIRGTDINNVDTWVTFKPTTELTADEAGKLLIEANANWKWKLGHDLTAEGEVIYMPTFNKNKDSLAADINGTYEGVTPGDAAHYDDYTPWAKEQPYTAVAVYDHDSNAEEEFSPESGKDPAWTSTTDDMTPEDAANVLLKTESHTAQVISSSSHVITMSQWQELLNNDVEGDETGAFWVWDEEDGWAYWAQAIQPGETTGLFLDGIQMYHVPDENWYYGINVVSQFVTSGDGGAFIEGSLSEGAKALMGELGVSLTVTDPSEPDDEGGKDDEEQVAFYAYLHTAEESHLGFLSPNKEHDVDIGIDFAGEEIPETTANISVSIEDLDGNDVTENFTEGEDYTLTIPENYEFEYIPYDEEEGTGDEWAMFGATLTVDESLYDHWVVIKVNGPETGVESEKAYMVCDGLEELAIQLYDTETGELATSTLKENRVYDVVVKLGEEIVFSTNNEKYPLSEKLDTVVLPKDTPCVYDHWEVTPGVLDGTEEDAVEPNAQHQIVTKENNRKDAEDQEIIISVGFDMVKMKGDTEGEILRYYVSGEYRPYFAGYLSLDLFISPIFATLDYNEEGESRSIIICDEGERAGENSYSRPFILNDGYTLDEEGALANMNGEIESWDIEGETSEDTKLVPEESMLYLGDDESAEELILHVKSKDGSETTHTVKVLYMTVKCNDALLTEKDSSLNLLAKVNTTETPQAKFTIDCDYPYDCKIEGSDSSIPVTDNELTVDFTGLGSSGSLNICITVKPEFVSDPNAYPQQTICVEYTDGSVSNGDSLVAELFSSSEGEYGSNEVLAGATIYIIARLHDAGTVVECEWSVEPEVELGDAEVMYNGENIPCKTSTVPPDATADTEYHISYSNEDYPDNTYTVRVVE